MIEVTQPYGNILIGIPEYVNANWLSNAVNGVISRSLACIIFNDE